MFVNARAVTYKECFVYPDLCRRQALIYQIPQLYFALGLSLLLLFLYLTYQLTPKGRRLRSLSAALAFSLAVGLVSYGLSLPGSVRGSRMVDNTLHPGLRKAVVTLLPRFPLLYGVPGFGYSAFSTLSACSAFLASLAAVRSVLIVSVVSAGIFEPKTS